MSVNQRHTVRPLNQNVVYMQPPGGSTGPSIYPVWNYGGKKSLLQQKNQGEAISWIREISWFCKINLEIFVILKDGILKIRICLMVIGV